MIRPQDIGRGEEQHELFTANTGGKGKRLCHYDYRDEGGELFSCVKKTLEECREARDEWMGRRGK